MLSPSQQRAEAVFKDFLIDPDQSELVISGFAGSGKSFLVKYLRSVAHAQMKVALAANISKGWNTYYTATTNKAASVLQGFLGEPVSTIHSTLGLKVRNDLRTGKVSLEATDKTKPLGRALVFVDEASMISRNLLGHIRDCMIPGETKVVFIGDRYQLAPVGEGHSVVFQHPKNIVHLTEIQRQVAGSPIIQTSQMYRSILDTGFKGWPAVNSNGAEINVVTGSELQNLVDQEYSKDHEPNDLKILAWTNDRVIAYNKHVRSLYTNSPHFVEGEKVIANDPVIKFGQVIFPTDYIVTITKIEPAVEDGVDGFEVTLNRGYRGFMPNSWKVAKAKMSHYAKDKNWRSYFHIKEEWLDLRPLHASTCHKSQGSTYKKVFIDVSDIGENKKWDEISRLMYVAISRASEAVYLYGSLTDRKWKKVTSVT